MIIEILSKPSFSKATEYSSFINKEIEELNFKNGTSPKTILKCNDIFKASSVKNIKKIKLLLNKEKPSLLHNLKEDIKNDIPNKKIKQEERNNLKDRKYEENSQIIKSPEYNKNNNILENKVQKDKNNNIIFRKNNEKEKKVKNSDLYGQNYNLEILRENPPRSPDLFYHKYNFTNQKVLSKDNENFNVLNKNNIPNVFYNHLVINENNIGFNNRCKYKKISITKRNKNRLLTIIYYSP